jgi:hypothetical protein
MHCPKCTVQNALLLYRIAAPQASPFITSASGSTSLSFPGLDGSDVNAGDGGAIQTTDNSLLSSSNSAALLDTKDFNSLLGLRVLMCDVVVGVCGCL